MPVSSADRWDIWVVVLLANAEAWDVCQRFWASLEGAGGSAVMNCSHCFTVSTGGKSLMTVS